MTDDLKLELHGAVRDFEALTKLAAIRIDNARKRLSTERDADEMRRLQGEIREAEYWQKLGNLIRA